MRTKAELHKKKKPKCGYYIRNEYLEKRIFYKKKNNTTTLDNNEREKIQLFIYQPFLC